MDVRRAAQQIPTTHGWAGYGRPDRGRFCGRCSCGWESPPLTTAGMAMAAFDRHLANPLLEGFVLAPADRGGTATDVPRARPWGSGRRAGGAWAARRAPTISPRGQEGRRDQWS